MWENVYIFHESLRPIVSQYFFLLSLSLLLLRVAIGLILVYHGSQKLLGLFGGGGPRKTIEAFKGWLGTPPFLTVLLMITEFFGGLGIIFGLLTRLSAFAVCIAMLVATLVDTSGFREAKRKGESVDPTLKIGFPALVFLIALTLLLVGPGRFSLDHFTLMHWFNWHWFLGP